MDSSDENFSHNISLSAVNKKLQNKIRNICKDYEGSLTLSQISNQDPLTRLYLFGSPNFEGHNRRRSYYLLPVSYIYTVYLIFKIVS